METFSAARQAHYWIINDNSPIELLDEMLFEKIYSQANSRIFNSLHSVDGIFFAIAERTPEQAKVLFSGSSLSKNIAINRWRWINRWFYVLFMKLPHFRRLNEISTANQGWEISNLQFGFVPLILTVRGGKSSKFLFLSKINFSSHNFRDFSRCRAKIVRRSSQFSKESVHVYRVSVYTVLAAWESAKKVFVSVAKFSFRNLHPQSLIWWTWRPRLLSKFKYFRDGFFLSLILSHAGLDILLAIEEDKHLGNCGEGGIGKSNY